MIDIDTLAAVETPVIIWVLDYSTGQVYTINITTNDNRKGFHKPIEDLTNDDYETIIEAKLPNIRIQDCNWMISPQTIAEVV